MHLEADPAIFELAGRALAEGNSLRATARIVQVDKDTVCAWLARAGQQCRLGQLYFWRELSVPECQLDELWSFVHTKEHHLPFAELYDETYSDAWVWVAFAPGWHLVVAFVVGKRTQASADLLLQCVAHVTDVTMPFFTSTQLPEYRAALLNTYGQWYQPPRRGTRGRYPKPRQKPAPDLLYAQVVKKRERGRVVDVSTQIVFGTPEAVAARLAASSVSQTINTSFVERDNLTWRQSNPRLTRRTNAFSKDLTWFEKQLWLSNAYYHFVLPHQSLRERLLSPEPTRGNGSPRKWHPVTPRNSGWSHGPCVEYREIAGLSRARRVSRADCYAGTFVP